MTWIETPNVNDRCSPGLIDPQEKTPETKTKIEKPAKEEDISLDGPATINIDTQSINEAKKKELPSETKKSVNMQSHKRLGSMHKCVNSSCMETTGMDMMVLMATSSTLNYTRSKTKEKFSLQKTKEDTKGEKSYITCIKAKVH